MAMTNLAGCLIYEQKYLEAEQLLRKALSLDANFIPAKQNLDMLINKKE